jgi:hypothetical protein
VLNSLPYTCLLISMFHNFREAANFIELMHPTVTVQTLSSKNLYMQTPMENYVLFRQSVPYVPLPRLPDTHCIYLRALSPRSYRFTRCFTNNFKSERNGRVTIKLNYTTTTELKTCSSVILHNSLAFILFCLSRSSFSAQLIQIYSC